jgi:tRNA/tmRNA/rRNA uracil-C5-methylase (TrmA/RlmC/RlmD family)
MPSTSGEVVHLPIQDVAFGGKGVGRHEGLAVFVPFVIAGEQVTARLTRRKKNFAEAQLLSVEQPSPDRVQPGCPYFGACGGCAYQHIAYPRQLEMKSSQVEQSLRRLGHFEHVPMQPAIASAEQYHYRNRIRVHAEGTTVGFYRHDRHELIDINQCPIATAEVNSQLGALRRTLTRDGDYVLSGERRDYFVQTNDSVATALVAHVRALILPTSRILIDAYSGAGFFARELATSFTRVIGIEENERAVEYARRIAASNESYVQGDVALRLGDVLASVPAPEVTLILDPPAIGASPRVLDFILGATPSQIIYVSCNPSTLARDLETLCRSTYKLQSVTPLDMFPQTAEIEAVAHLTLNP